MREQMRLGAQFAAVIAASVIADDRGQDLIEYVLLTAIIGVAGLLVLSTLPTTMHTRYTNRNAAVQNAWQPCPPLPAGCP